MDNISLIDWGALAANVLWIFGLGLALAAVSFAGFEANSTHITLGRILRQRNFDLTLNLAGILFCSGLAATSSPLLEQILWITLAILFMINLLLSFRKKQPE